MDGYPFYFIDVEGSPQDFKFILRSIDGQIVHTLENSKELAQYVDEMVRRVVYHRYGLLSVSVSYFEDHKGLIYAFYKAIYPILLEQYLSNLYESRGIRIQYPDQNTYLIVLFKLYKIVSNPQSTLTPQEYAILISPLINKIHWGVDENELMYLFKEFVRSYYKVMDIKRKARIGYNQYGNIQPFNPYPNNPNQNNLYF